MTPASITAILEASAAIVTAATALVAAIRGGNALKSHVAACTGTSATSPTTTTPKGAANG